MKKITYILIALIILIFFYEIEVFSSTPFQLNLPPNLPTYTTIVQDTAQNIGGSPYYYAATAYPGLLKVKSGITNPIVDILPQLGTVKDNIIISTRVQSLQRVKKYQLFLYKYDSRSKGYRPVAANPLGKYCSFKCEGINCNLLEEQIVPSKDCSGGTDCTFKFGFDTTKCDNKKFVITAYGTDFLDHYNNDTLIINTNNPNPPCIDECYLFNSQLLNTVYLKIKSWVT
jgi:hypothetical protein